MLEAFNKDHLVELIESNSSAPDWVDEAVVERIISYARGRADSRGEESALDGNDDYLILTNWSSFTEDWGFSNGSSNEVAIGSLNDEAGSKADLFENTDILQTAWLRSGDGRKKQAERYEDKEVIDEFGGSVGDMWIPHNAQSYICIIELSGELIHGKAGLEEAM